jgi:hypothetical protein
VGRLPAARVARVTPLTVSVHTTRRPFINTRVTQADRDSAARGLLPRRAQAGLATGVAIAHFEARRSASPKQNRRAASPPVRLSEVIPKAYQNL